MIRFPQLSAGAISLVAGAIWVATIAAARAPAVIAGASDHERRCGPAAQAGFTHGNGSCPLGVLAGATLRRPASEASLTRLRFRVSVMGMSGWGLGARLRSIGITWDRIDVGNGTNIGDVRYALQQRVKVLVLFNPVDPRLAGMSPRTAARDVRRLALEILPLGLHEIEFGNEVYDHGSTPQSYAAQYAAAHAAVAGLHITLIANSFGDYQRPDGTWSQDAKGGGWIHDFIHALPAKGREIDAFSIHPYGPMDRLGSGEDGGWPSVGRYHELAVANGVNVPWYITEVGQNLGGSDTSPPVDLATQAADVTQYLNDTLVEYPYVTYLDFYAIKDNRTGRWGLLNSNDSPRPAFEALARWMAAHTGA
jgi:hypothetical protein